MVECSRQFQADLKLLAEQVPSTKTFVCLQKDTNTFIYSMGNSLFVSQEDSCWLNRLNSTESHMRNLLEIGELVWTPENVAAFFLHNKLPYIAMEVLRKRIDGECLIESNPDTLVSWLFGPDTKSKDRSRLLSLVDQMRQGKMVQIFLNPPGSDKIQKLRESDQCELPQGELSVDQAIQIILSYHEYTSHLKTKSAPSLSRNWVNQPKISRRYYTSPIIRLSLPEEESFSCLDSILFYSFSNSGGQNEGQASMWPRARGSKRVNPSSGGLHPVEVNVIRKLNNAVEVLHYVPLQHALELRAKMIAPNDNYPNQAIPAEAFIFGISTILWREMWKYGPRGWRYTQLDIGHALGALGLSAQMHNYQVHVLDLALHPTIGDCFALKQIITHVEKRQDWRENEILDVVVFLLPRSDDFKPISDAVLIDLLKEISNSLEKTQLHGTPNQIFSRSNSPEQWPFADAVQKASCVSSHPVTVGEKLIIQDEAGEKRLFQNVQKLKQSIRARRSVLDFNPERSLTIDQFVGCLQSVLDKTNPINREVMGFSPSYTHPSSSLFFAIWVNHVESFPSGLYVLLRHSGDDYHRQFLDSWNLLQAVNWVKVSHERIPDWMPLYFVSSTLLRPIVEKNQVKTFKDKPISAQASEVSCYQNIAATSSMVLAMMVPLADAVQLNPRNYSYLHWEAGYFGQMLYVQAYEEQVGATGMGCFLDDISREAFQFSSCSPLYHFAVGVPVNDGRYSPYCYEDRVFPQG